MKMMFCQECSDLVLPNPDPKNPKQCKCLRHSVWWEDPRAGVLRLNDNWHKPREDSGSIYKHFPREPRAYVVGFSNVLFRFEGRMDAEVVTHLIDSHPDTYLFKKWRSLVIRIRPGESNDTSWAALPL